MKLLQGIALIAALLSYTVVGAQAPDHRAHHEAKPAATAPMVEGEVRKVDKDAGKLTLKHEAIPNLEMPNMTMVFVEIGRASCRERV